MTCATVAFINQCKGRCLASANIFTTTTKIHVFSNLYSLYILHWQWVYLIPSLPGQISSTLCMQNCADWSPHCLPPWIPTWFGQAFHSTKKQTQYNAKCEIRTRTAKVSYTSADGISNSKIGVSELWILKKVNQNIWYRYCKFWGLHPHMSLL